MHTIRFSLQTTAYEEHILEKRFRIVSHMHNETVKYAQRQLNTLRRDRAYIDAKKEYGQVLVRIDTLNRNLEKMKAGSNADRHKYAAMKQTLSAQKHRLRTLAEVLNGRIRSFSLTKTDFDRFVAVMQHRFRQNVTSQQAQKEAERVYAGVEQVLYGNGTSLHLKKLADQHTVSQKCATNGVKVDLPHGTLSWLGLDISFRIDRTDPYVAESVDHPLKYAEITRLAFDSGWRYYVILYLDGPAPEKLDPADGGFATGIDPGVSTFSSVSENGVSLQELAPLCQDYNRRIAREMRLIDHQMRLSNPGNYNPDGTVKKGHRCWIITKGCRRRKRKLRTLYRKKADSAEQSHSRQVNELLVRNGTRYITEDMTYKALQKRSKKPAERRDAETTVTRKDGSTKTIRRFKRKKRFGRSLNDRAPALFLTILERKAEQYGGCLVKVDTKAFRASQYHHDTDMYVKPPLSERWKVIDGHRVQRDLYSAYLLLCSNPDGTAPDRDLCLWHFDRFLAMHDAFIRQTKGQPHPACFGY